MVNLQSILLLIDKNTPILGVIHIPITNETYWGSKVNGSFYSNKNNDVKTHTRCRKSSEPDTYSGK